MGAAAALAALLAAPAAGAAQTDSVTVAPGPHYAAGGLHSWLLGRHYRDLWTTPIRVPVLDLGSFAGGLTPVRRGGGQQTISLRFRAGDGREYNFRSVDKDQSGGMHPDFHDTLVDRVAQDQVSSKHPTSALITDPLLHAAGVLHPEPRLFVMPDDPRLGEFRAEFAGLLGMIELHPDEGQEGAPGFAGAVRVTDTEGLLENLEESPVHRADARAFLRARLVDFFLGDWDRHPGQWRWARFDQDGVRRWVPVPEDRDNAFSNYDGWVMDLVRTRAPNLVEFRSRYPSVFALTLNGQILDRRLLSGVPGEVFDSMAVDLQGRFGDDVLEHALTRAPPEHHALRGAELLQKLRARRAALPQIARAFYAQLALEPEIRGTDEPDLALVDRHPDGSVEVRLFAPDAGAPATQPFFRRRFHPGETREVRIYLHGGDDRAVVRGEAEERLLVRVMGGGGDDLLADSSRVAGRSRTAFYDHRGDNRFITLRGTRVDTRAPLRADSVGSGFNDNRPPARDWGRETAWFRPRAEWRYNLGPVVGGGPEFTRYGFRRLPHAHRLSGRVLYAPLETRFGVEAAGDVRLTNSYSRTTFAAHASQLEVTRFHGFGNATPGDADPELYKLRETELRVEALFHQGFGPRAEAFFGPVLQYTRPEVPFGGPAEGAAAGTASFGQVGGRAGAALDTRDLPSFPRRGTTAQLSATFFPVTIDLPGSFGAVDASASVYLPVPLPLESTLAVRAGGRRAWGDFPLQEAAFVGGESSLRGFPRQRYAGDLSVFGGAELRTYLTRVNFISRGDLGIIALADAGRVFVDGQDGAGGWHVGYGGGFWVGILDRTRTFSVVAATGEEPALYVELGMPF